LKDLAIKIDPGSTKLVGNIFFQLILTHFRTFSDFASYFTILGYPPPKKKSLGSKNKLIARIILRLSGGPNTFFCQVSTLIKNIEYHF